MNICEKCGYKESQIDVENMKWHLGGEFKLSGEEIHTRLEKLEEKNGRNKNRKKC